MGEVVQLLALSSPPRSWVPILVGSKFLEIESSPHMKILSQRSAGGREFPRRVLGFPRRVLGFPRRVLGFPLAGKADRTG